MSVDLKACGPATLRKMLAALRSREVRLDEKIGALMSQRADCGVEMAAVLREIQARGVRQ